MAKRGRPSKHPFAKLAKARLNASNSQNLTSALYIKQDIDGADINQELIDGCRELIADYRKGLGMGKLIPTDIFMAYGSIGSEDLTPEDEAIINANYKAAVTKGKKDQKKGSKGGKEKALVRAQAVWSKAENKNLVTRINSGSLTLNSATTIILSSWGARGDDEVKPPSPKTLSNWYYILYPKNKYVNSL